jgi:hypothetical protein
MEAFPFDDHDRDAVFGAAEGTPDVPESLRGVADLVRAARRSGSADELVAETETVAAIAAAMTASGSVTADPRRGADERTPVFRKFRAAKLAAAATVTLMVGGTAAAAATGALPTPVQSNHRVELASSHGAATPVVAHHEMHGNRRHVFGTVASVNGVSDPGTCGVADTDGTFTVEGHKGKTWTVDVTADTTFSVNHETDPSFADVCVDSLVKARGTVAGTTLTASTVRVKDHKVHGRKHERHERKGAFGMVASVNGVSDPGTCGAADAAGTFTVTGFKGETFTVNVDPSTAFAAKDVSDASFANVCVGLLAFAKGDVTDATVAATAVFVVPPKTDDPGHDHGDRKGVFGEVTSVNGVSDDGTCGTAGADGSFTIVDHDGNTITVDVTAATKYFGKRHHDGTDASFADVCVGKKAGAKGEQTDAIVAADMVFVSGDKHDCDGRHDGDRHHDGKDASFTSRRGDDGGHDGHRHGDWGGKDRPGDGGWDHHGHGHDDDER